MHPITQQYGSDEEASRRRRQLHYLVDKLLLLQLEDTDEYKRTAHNQQIKVIERGDQYAKHHFTNNTHYKLLSRYSTSIGSYPFRT